ncbi:F-box domain-containing protein [Mycena sanguinolenta]|uniref:F-box domain-containing protein n=1 Tax=Mycena sanguinolenta TaxID=230812 RepID=A0A8H7DIS2_9AGAR|nr:F-box domain-containing protein [Mycena sanguinolenta]
MNYDPQPTTSPVTVCPALTLPVEIISKIFLFCVSAGDITSELGNPLNNPPFVLTKICRYWRLIALSMGPGFWSNIQLEFGGRHGRRTGHIDSWWLSFLKTWFSRARDQPLTVVISNLNHIDPDQGLVPLLESHRLQWRDLTIKLPFNRFYQFAPQEKLPILERLVLGAHAIPPMVHTPVTAFQMAPKLKHVCLDGYLRPSQFILPWAQLTSIELTAACGEDCLECLRQASRLISCSFGIHGRDQSLGSVPPHRRVASLALSGAAPTVILPSIRMPALEDLDIVGRSLNKEELSRIPLFVSRCRCGLRRLRLHFISELMTSAAIELLEALPSLETLELAATGASTIRTLFSSLSRYGEPFLPFLRNLSLSHHRMSDDNMRSMFEDMAGLLVRRSAAVPEHVQLQSFSLTIESERTVLSSRIIQKLQELADRGMDLNIRNRRERWI